MFVGRELVDGARKPPEVVIQAARACCHFYFYLLRISKDTARKDFRPCGLVRIFLLPRLPIVDFFGHER
jgi:hypothetical protein